MHNRNLALEGFRGFAMLMVFAFHCIFITSQTSVDRAYLELTRYMWIGMHFFFALSGYLITGILLDSKGEKKYYTNFYARRFLRIFPLYYAVLLFALVVLPNFPHPKLEKFATIRGDEWSYWTYLCNLTIGQSGAWRHPIVDVAWSLAVEEQFYVVWPLVVAWLSVKRLFQTSVTIIVAAVAYRGFMVWNGDNPIAIYVSTGARFDAIAAGALVAIAMRYRSRWTDWCISNHIQLLIYSAISMAALLAAVRGDYDTRPAQIFGHGLAALLSGALILNLTVPTRPKRLVSFFETRIFRIVGAYSYGFYLFHLPLRGLIRDLIYKPEAFLTLWGSQLPGQLIFNLLSGIFVLGAAWLSFRFFENPLLGFKRYFEYEKRKSSEAPLSKAA